MCGIVSLFPKQPELEPRVGALLADMLCQMTERGPDSAGFALYRDAVPDGQVKLTLQSESARADWGDLHGRLRKLDGHATLADHGNHAVVLTAIAPAEALAWLEANASDYRVTSWGRSIEIYKEKGSPEHVIEQLHLRELGATHALGHTRMATESAVTTEHSHPFSTGLDLCLVHNGSLSNHNRLRDGLTEAGIHFQTDNDSEVAAGYLTHRLAEGDSLEQALDHAIRDLDGFYTFAIGTRDGFAVLRDPIACKPAVLAETDEWVAMASEFRAIATLPGAETAHTWEPEPARVYSWER